MFNTFFTAYIVTILNFLSSDFGIEHTQPYNCQRKHQNMHRLLSLIHLQIQMVVNLNTTFDLMSKAIARFAYTSNVNYCTLRKNGNSNWKKKVIWFVYFINVSKKPFKLFSFVLWHFLVKTITSKVLIGINWLNSIQWQKKCNFRIKFRLKPH